MSCISQFLSRLQPFSRTGVTVLRRQAIPFSCLAPVPTYTFVAFLVHDADGYHGGRIPCPRFLDQPLRIIGVFQKPPAHRANVYIIRFDSSTSVYYTAQCYKRLKPCCSFADIVS